MKRRKCVTLIIVSAIAGVGTSVSAVAVMDSRTDADGTALGAAKLTPIPTEEDEKKKESGQPKTQTGNGAGGGGQTKPKAPELFDLGVENLIASGDLAAANFPVDAASSGTFAGDLSYSLSDCMRSGMGGITGNKVFSGSYNSADGQKVSESISTVSTAAVAERVAQTIVGWHSGTCGGSAVGPQTRLNVDGGWIVRVELSQEQEVYSTVAIVKVGRNIAVVDARLLAYDAGVQDRLFQSAAVRLL